MSLPRDPRRDLSLEHIADREGRGPAPLGQTAIMGDGLASHSINRDFRTAYEALIDAVFTSHGATEWLLGLRRAVTALISGKTDATPTPVASDAIRPAETGSGRS